MKRTITACLLMTTLFSMHAMDDLGDICSTPPAIDVAGAKIIKSKSKHRTTFYATLAAGNSIKVTHREGREDADAYEGEHFFTTAKGTHMSDDLNATRAQALFKQCAYRYTEQAAERVSQQTSSTWCTLQ